MNADKRRLDLFELFIFLKTTEGTEDYGKYNARPRVSEWGWGEEGRRRVWGQMGMSIAIGTPYFISVLIYFPEGGGNRISSRPPLFSCKSVQHRRRRVLNVWWCGVSGRGMDSRQGHRWDCGAPKFMFFVLLSE